MKSFSLIQLGRRIMMLSLLVCCAIVARGQSKVEIDGIVYLIYNDRTAEVQGCATSWPSEVIIPETIEYNTNVFTVTAIEYYAFQTDEIISITLPNSIKEIKPYAFRYCSNLTYVNIGNSVSSIGEGAFEECKSLTSIDIPKSVTDIGSGVFTGCESLESINVDPDNENFMSIDGVLFKKNNRQQL